MFIYIEFKFFIIVFALFVLREFNECVLVTFDVKITLYFLETHTFVSTSSSSFWYSGREKGVVKCIFQNN